MAKALRGADHVLPDRRDRRPRGVRHRLGAGQGVAGRHDQRLHRGLPRRARHQGRVGSARLLRQPREDRRRSRSSRQHAQWFEDRMPWDPKYRKAGRARHHRQRHRRRHRDGRLRARSRRSASTCRTIRTIRERYGSKSVSLSNVNEAYDKSTLPEFRQRVLVDAGGSGARDEVERVRRRAHDQHARGDRPRVGQGRGAAERQARRRRSRNSSRRSKKRAPISSRCISCRIRKLVELGLVPAEPIRTRSSAPKYESVRAQRARAAAARPRGHADRRRPHAQPPDDRPLADGEHEGDRRARRATARPTT